MKLFLIETCELAKAHLHDGFALRLVEGKASLQSTLSILWCLTLFNNVNNFVDIVAGNDEAFQNVSSLFCLAQIIFGTTDGDFVAMSDEVADEVLQSKQLWTSFHQSNTVHAETRLQWCHLEKLIQNDTSVCIALQIDDNSHTFAVAFVIDIADTVNLLFTDKLCDVFNKLLFVNAVWNLAHDNLVVCLTILNLGLCTDYNTSSACFVSIADSLHTHDVGTRREVWAFHILH